MPPQKRQGRTTNNKKKSKGSKDKNGLQKKHKGGLFGDKLSVTFFQHDAGLYGRYQEAIQTIQTELGGLVPSKVMNDRVSSLMDAVD